jgi:hypothetical protein
LIPLMKTARRAGRFDNEWIDGFVDGVAGTVRRIGGRLRNAQRGQMQENLAFAFGIAALLIVVLVIYTFR